MSFDNLFANSNRFHLNTEFDCLAVGNVLPFVVYAITDSNEQLDIGNRGFALSYSQNECPVI